MQSLTNKNILLAVTGSIAAYKAPDIIRRLQELGAEVQVILSQGGRQFITKLSLEVISKNKVYDDLWAENQEFAHIDLVRWADLVLIAPASANTISHLAQGQAVDLLTTAILANDVPLMIAPAMNQQMFKAQVTQDNLNLLKKRGVISIESSGVLACGEVGVGRLAEIEVIIDFVVAQFKSSDLTGKKVLITAGATVEDIDPVRFISNRSSGKMGFALANSCVEMGAKVVLIYGNVTVELPNKTKNIYSRSADDMFLSVMENIEDCDIFIGCAAVADYKIKEKKAQKIKKDKNELVLNLIKNKDIISEVTKKYPNKIAVGFAAESENLLENAQKKLENKRLNMIIANEINHQNMGFDSDDNAVQIITKKGIIKCQKNSKKKIAKKIILEISNQFFSKKLR
jgi:phosphopantothenoylcysteine decarboxylase/phosphopantothenate--cysteine ligase